MAVNLVINDDVWFMKKKNWPMRRRWVNAGKVAAPVCEQSHYFTVGKTPEEEMKYADE